MSKIEIDDEIYDLSTKEGRKKYLDYVKIQVQVIYANDIALNVGDTLVVLNVKGNKVWLMPQTL